MMYYCVGINTIILLSVSQLGTLFASGALFWCYIIINKLYIKKRLFGLKWQFLYFKPILSAPLVTIDTDKSKIKARLLHLGYSSNKPIR